MNKSEKVVKAKSFANQLRVLADAYDKYPETLPTPNSALPIDFWVQTKEELAAFARVVRNVKKTYSDSWIEFDWRIGNMLRYRLNISRDKVCRLVETGELEHVPEEIRIIAAHDRPVTKWVCDDPAFLPSNDEKKE